MDDALRAQIDRREVVLRHIQQLLVDRLQAPMLPDALEPDAPLFGAGLGLDSIDAVELVIALEDTFQVKLPERALKKGMRTMNTLADLVLEHT